MAQQVTARLTAADIEMPYLYRQITTRVADEGTHAGADATSDAGDATDR
jgi:hypothetical protein